MMRSLPALLAPLVLLLASACATTAHDPRDPWEPLNRKTYALNDALDRHVMRPAAEAYVKVTPAYVRARVNDFFGNIGDIATGLNDFLQGKAREGINDFGRIVVNTTFGVAGLWDVASRLGVEKRDEDFGQTLGVWGVPPGPYFVIPFLGPSTARDAPARAADPSWYYSRYIEDDRVYWGLWTLDAVRTRANLLKASNILEQAALDPYIFTRDAWLQRRRNQVYDGKPPLEDDESDAK
jgi:phospholipid-binding lipoprotein MlaA